MDVFIDMDGVLADFTKSALSLFNITEYEVPTSPSKACCMTNWKGMENISINVFWELLNKSGIEFWYNLDKTEWADDLILKCKKDFDNVYILTTPSKDPMCLAGKAMWVDKYYPDMSSNVIYTKHKKLLAHADAILLDDMEYNIQSFENNGGSNCL